jgi:ATP-binding cassette subfamily B protein
MSAESAAIRPPALTSTPPRRRSIRSLRGLLPFLRPYRTRIAVALLFLLLAAASTLSFPLALRWLIDAGMLHARASRASLGWHFAGLFALAAALGVFSAARFYMVSWLGERVTADVRSAVYAHVLRQSPQFFEHTQTGEVLSRLTADTTLVQTVVGTSFSMGLRNLVVLLGAMTMLIITNPGLMLGVLLVIAVVVAPAVLIGRRVRGLSRASQDRIADASAIAAEVLAAMPVVQSYAREADEAQRFRDSAETAFRTAISRNQVRALLTAFIIVALFGALLYGLYLGTVAVIEGRMSAGTLGQTVLYIGLVAGSAAALAEVFGDLLRAAGATERLMELLAAQSPVRNPDHPVTFPVVRGGSEVVLDHVRFFYPSRPDKPALDDFSLRIAPGETVALVGPSGAGKTTVLQLLLRFYDAQHGSIHIDGVEVEQADFTALRRRIGLVPQDAVIFSASAADNIRYGRPDASDAEVRAAARAAQAEDFILDLPQGFDTYLGERGVRLSGGQKQRISIARAILKNAPLLLLDEATSALDAASERAVQTALEHAMSGRTTIVVAHRLATVQRADRIVVMESGRIVDIGTHAELMQRGGLYASLAALQFLQ